MDGSASLSQFTERLRVEFERRFPRSLAALHSAGPQLLGGTSHSLRGNNPFMVLVDQASGSQVFDLDGHRIIDYWQGHYANLLGHNPRFVTEALAEELSRGKGLHDGMLHEIEHHLAELLCARTGMDRARFTTSGSLATFYATLLARCFTNRKGVLKVSGGWHGSQPFGLKGVSSRDGTYDHLESEGLPESLGDEILLVKYNDVVALRKTFAEQGRRIACFIVEPLLGSGGGITATREFLAEARRLTSSHGALLISDEIISGFRFRAGDLISSYGVTADLLVLGKIIGGGMPVAAVLGREDVMRLCTPGGGSRVRFEGGTYSAHPLALLAARTMVEKLCDAGSTTYAELANKGEWLRAELIAQFERLSVPVCVTGSLPAGMGGSSVVMWHFVKQQGLQPSCAEDLTRKDRRHPVVDAALFRAVSLLEDLHVKGGGCVSGAHSDADLKSTLQSVANAVARLREAELM